LPFARQDYREEVKDSERGEPLQVANLTPIQQFWFRNFDIRFGNVRAGLELITNNHSPERKF
jgi:hypothetical protein